MSLKLHFTQREQSCFSAGINCQGYIEANFLQLLIRSRDTIYVSLHWYNLVSSILASG